MEQHKVTPHWHDDDGHVTHRTCSCGQAWHADDARCPDDDGRHELVEAACVVWKIGFDTPPGTVGGLRARAAVDTLLAVIAADFDDDECAFVKAYVERFTPAEDTT